MNKISPILIVVFVLLSSISAENNAQNSANKTFIHWQQLSPEMQILLGEYKSDWMKQTALQRQQLIQQGKQWLSHSEQKQHKLWQRFQHWQNMSSQQRLNMQKNYHYFQSLSQVERKKMMQTQHIFGKMSLEQQNIMMQRFYQFQQRGGEMTANDMQKKMSENMGEISMKEISIKEMSLIMQQRLNNSTFTVQNPLKTP